MANSTPRALRAIEKRHPGWHAFASDTGHLYASGPNATDATGMAGVTRHSDTPRGLDAAIADWETWAGREAARAIRLAA